MATAALPYKPDDDATADRYVNEALRTRLPESWRLLCHPRYVLQTERILLSTLDQIKRSITQRKADFDDIRDQRAKLRITHAEYEDAKRDWQDWKGRIEHFEGTVRQYIRMVSDHARPIRGDRLAPELATTLLALASAVHQHRASTLLDNLEPTPADRALWARLDLLHARTDELDDPVTLAELVAPAPPEPELDHPVSDIAMLCARLLLQLAGTGTSVPRLKLAQQWKQRASFLDDSGKTTDGNGSYSAKVLGHTLRRWDRDKIIRRVTDGPAQTIEILDPDRLLRLAHPD